ncbi:Lysophosphatidic acid phosphatase type 6 [Perkinsus olseni]|uniref:Lysophosphatidic acid phosphatase type 6 n=3 Tax=Perkinsus olseni TaxID=32597 RepID=A0A7J6NG28_PEROL|nr:Lysophosphatidic acid phosphatase type 6 [Perkinsus olseni]
MMMWKWPWVVWVLQGLSPSEAFPHSPLSIAEDDDYCFRRPLQPYPKLNNITSKVRLTSVQVYVRHAQRDEYTHHSCFPKGQQVNYTKDCNRVHVDYAIDEVAAVSGLKLRKVFVDSEGRETCETGQLLNGAKDQMTRVAHWLRDAYLADGASLSDVVNLELISTDKSRTLGSLYYLLSAFLRPQDELPKTLDVRVQDNAEDALGLNYRDCPRVKALEGRFNTGRFVQTQSHSDSYHSCANLYTQLVGPVNFDLSAANDCFLSQYCSTSTYPPGVTVTPSLFNCVTNLRAERRFVEYGFKGFSVADDDPSWTPQDAVEKCSLRVAPVVRGLLSRARSKGKLYLIGTHDTTVACLLQALGGLWDGHWPHYGETVSVETYQSEQGRRFFRILRNHKIVNFPGCPPASSFCPLSVLEGFITSDPVLASEAYRERRCQEVADLADSSVSPRPPGPSQGRFFWLWTIMTFVLGCLLGRLLTTLKQQQVEAAVLEGSYTRI